MEVIIVNGLVLFVGVSTIVMLLNMLFSGAIVMVNEEDER